MNPPVVIAPEVAEQITGRYAAGERVVHIADDAAAGRCRWPDLAPAAQHWGTILGHRVARGGPPPPLLPRHPMHRSASGPDAQE